MVLNKNHLLSGVSGVISPFLNHNTSYLIRIGPHSHSNAKQMLQLLGSTQFVLRVRHKLASTRLVEVLLIRIALSLLTGWLPSLLRGGTRKTGFL